MNDYYDPPQPELVGKYGYGCEVHPVTTADGYILNLHRVTLKNGHNCAKRVRGWWYYEDFNVITKLVSIILL